MIRLISQNGLYDIPYDSNIVKIVTNEEPATHCVIYAGDILMAAYTSQEKAIKILSTLYKIYETGCSRIFIFPTDKEVNNGN